MSRGKSKPMDPKGHIVELGYILTKMESLPCNDAFETDGMHLLSLLSAIYFFLHNNPGTDIGC